MACLSIIRDGGPATVAANPIFPLDPVIIRGGRGDQVRGLRGERRRVALLHGSVIWRRGVDGIGGRAPFLTPDRRRAIQSEPRSPSSHPEAAAQGDELGRL
jgi:hypothetical protein